MSSSDAAAGWGNIYRGVNTVSLSALEGGNRQTWTEADEAAYLERVRAKAADKAAEILAAARREAGELRKNAREQGYAAGLAQAEEEVAELRSAMADSVSSVLGAIEGQCSSIFERWRGELGALLRLAVEKGTGLALSGDRAGLLEALYAESVSALENRRNLIIRVNPEDEPVIADIVALTQDKYPDLKSWGVKGDDSVEPGGLVVESEDSLVDNQPTKRRALVDEILERLTLPPDC
jgi:flagellar assembly protein FliH